MARQLREGQLHSAAESAERLRQSYPNNVVGYREAGLVLRRLGRFDDAHTVLTAASHRFASHGWVAVELAWLALRRGRWDEAVDQAAAVRDADPASYPGYMIAVEALRMGGRVHDAQALLDEAAAKLTHTAWLCGEGAWIAEARNDLHDAARLWRQVRTDFPDDLAGYLGGVRVARATEQLDEADAIFVEGYAKFSQSGTLLAEGAHVAGLRHDFDQAAARWSALRTLEPANEAAYRHGIDMAEAAGQADAAASLLEEALARFPTASWVAGYRTRFGAADGDEAPAAPPRLVNPQVTLVAGWQDCVDRIHDLLSGTAPCFLGRVGGSDTNAVAAALTNKARGQPADHPDVMAHLKTVERYNGYYDLDGDTAKFVRYIDAMSDSYAAARHLFFCNYQLLSLYFSGNLDKTFFRDEFENKVGFQLLYSETLGSRHSLEAYPYTFVEKLASHPQTLMNVLAKVLPGKRVLVISPFSRSIQANYQNRHSFFKNYRYPEFSLQVFNTPITYAGLPPRYYPHRDWFETTEAMTRSISRLDFDIALLSCGSYAMPLGQHIAATMGKQAIYVGGVLQLMFGIMGRRYNNKFILDQINPMSFINPVEAKDFLGHVAVAKDTAHEAFGAYF